MNPAGSQTRYWGFYWPLALTGIVALLANQLQNATLARYPDPARELATFAIATGVFHLFDAALIFLPQMVNVLARSRAAARRCLRFTVTVCLSMTVPVLVLAIPAIGRPALRALFHIEGETLDAVLIYLLLLSPNILMLGLRHYYNGRIVQSRRTGWVTVLNTVYLAIVWILLATGRAAGWRATVTLAVAPLVASAIHLALLRTVAGRVCDREFHGETGEVRWTEINAFFWPVALTSVMFSLTRPILYLFLARLPDPAPIIASMRVGFDFAMIFHNLLNQFRHLFATFGKDDLAGVRRFMIRVTVAVIAGMGLVAATPISTFVLQRWIGVQGEVLRQSRQVLMAMCLLPATVAWRNYFHGLALVNRRTGPMGLGGLMRNLATYFAAWALFRLGGLTHVSAALILVLGFVAETVTVIGWPRLILRIRGARDPG